MSFSGPFAGCVPTVHARKAGCSPMGGIQKSGQTMSVNFHQFTPKKGYPGIREVVYALTQIASHFQPKSGPTNCRPQQPRGYGRRTCNAHGR